MDGLEILFYESLDRIDPDDIDVAQDYLIGCITFLKRKESGRADRDRVREDVILNRGMEKYVSELKIISSLSNDALATLIASSIDLSNEIKRVLSLYEKVKLSCVDGREAKIQAGKAKKASDMFARIAKLLDTTKIPNKKKSKKYIAPIGKSLFDEVV